MLIILTFIFRNQCKRANCTVTNIILFSDIKVKEPTEESLTKKVKQYMDPKFMSVKEAAVQLVKVIEGNPDSGIIFNFQIAQFCAF